MCRIRFDLSTAEPHVAPSDAGGRISQVSTGTEVPALARTHPTQSGGESHVGNRRGPLTAAAPLYSKELVAADLDRAIWPAAVATAPGPRTKGSILCCKSWAN
jgi:hypothetical protein